MDTFGRSFRFYHLEFRLDISDGQRSKKVQYQRGIWILSYFREFLAELLWNLFPYDEISGRRHCFTQ